MGELWWWLVDMSMAAFVDFKFSLNPQLLSFFLIHMYPCFFFSHQTTQRMIRPRTPTTATRAFTIGPASTAPLAWPTPAASTAGAL